MVPFVLGLLSSSLPFRSVYFTGEMKYVKYHKANFAVPIHSTLLCHSLYSICLVSWMSFSANNHDLLLFIYQNTNICWVGWVLYTLYGQDTFSRDYWDRMWEGEQWFLDGLLLWRKDSFFLSGGQDSGHLGNRDF